MYRKILVALENSRTDEAILAHIEPLARLMNSELVLVHVADGWVARNLNELNLAESDEMREDRAYLERVRARFVDGGVPAQAVLLAGDPVAGIVKLATETERRPDRDEHPRPPLLGRPHLRIDRQRGAAHGPDPRAPRARLVK